MINFFEDGVSLRSYKYLVSKRAVIHIVSRDPKTSVSINCAANISTLFQRCLLVMPRRDVGQRQINVVYFNVGIYNIEERRINVMYFHVDMNNIRQRRNNVFILSLSFTTVLNVEIMLWKWPFLKKTKKNYQIEYTEFKVLTTIL